ncbi:MAG: 1-phosphofructokinase family hexose kinase [Caldilineaceae bacterium]|nr:1-phosphofructokinase family hexose kinase [Caldilineaceae bacterium]
MYSPNILIYFSLHTSGAFPPHVIINGMTAIITLTANPTVDKSTTTQQVVPENKLRCAALQHEPGGGGINVSRAIHQLGGDSIAFFLAGGPNGRILQSLLNEQQIVCHPHPIAGWTRESFSVYENATTLQYRFVMPGPDVQPAEWQDALNELGEMARNVDYIVASGSLPPGVPVDFYARVARLVRSTNTRLVVDTSGEALWETLNESVFMLKPNIVELETLMGHKFTEQAQIHDVASELIRDGKCEIMLISLGAQGAFVASAQGGEFLRAPTVPIQSKVGAGDSMVGGAVLALAQGRSTHEAMLYGVAAGSAAVMTPGSLLCRREDTEMLFAQMKLAQ